MKWSKASKAKFAGYQEIVSFIALRPDFHFVVGVSGVRDFGKQGNWRIEIGIVRIRGGLGSRRLPDTAGRRPAPRWRAGGWRMRWVAGRWNVRVS